MQKGTRTPKTFRHGTWRSNVHCVRHLFVIHYEKPEYFYNKINYLIAYIINRSETLHCGYILTYHLMGTYYTFQSPRYCGAVLWRWCCV